MIDWGVVALGVSIYTGVLVTFVAFAIFMEKVDGDS